MNKQKLERVLEQITREDHTTPEAVRREMQLALDAGQANKDPAVQARWRQIPHKGEKVTLEEFMEYATGLLNGVC